MKVRRVIAQSIFITAFSASAQLFGSSERELPREELNPKRFDLAVESGYLFGFINSPRNYEIGAEFVTARLRWGVNDTGNWLRGYNQVYLTAVLEPIFRGIENHYFGFNIGMRYNFVRPYWRLVPYFSGGFGAGAIDSHPNIPGGQGQDFTFNVLAALGVSYEISDRWKLNAGVLYEHLSNAGQTNPNPSLNLIGPQLGLTYAF
jgi:hypothetical protein